MAAITISRQLGSGGAAIAELVAQRLGFRLLDRELVDAIAARAGVSVETARSFDETYLDPLEAINYSFLLSLERERISPESYQYTASQLIREAATSRSVVVVGRAGQVVLGRYPDTLHVRVVAPFEDRVARVVERDRVGTQEAQRRVKESDEGRRQYVWSVGRRDWDDPLLYDLVVNTHRVRLEAAAKLISEAALAMLESTSVAARPPEAGRTGEESAPPYVVGRRAGQEHA